jgi:hypothetical protein
LTVLNTQQNGDLVVQGLVHLLSNLTPDQEKVDEQLLRGIVFGTDGDAMRADLALAHDGPLGHVLRRFRDT